MSDILSEQQITDWLLLAHVDSDIADRQVRDSHEALRARLVEAVELLRGLLSCHQGPDDPRVTCGFVARARVFVEEQGQ